MKTFLYIIILAVGIIAGWLIFAEHSTQQAAESEQSEQEWTCSMHPQIRMKEFGKCPLCGMDLIHAGKHSEAEANGNFTMSAAAVALSNVETILAKKSNPQKVLRLYGSVVPNERSIHTQTAHIGGRIEKLFVNYEGESVKKGQVIASVYSPELLTAQTEFLEAEKQKHPVILEAAKEKLRYLKISEKQIAELERSKRANANIDIVSDAGGVVVAKKAERGEHIEAGTPLFDVADLSSVWAVFNAYENDLPYLKVGDLIGYTAGAVPNEVWTGRVEFISPIVDEMSRTAKVRMETQNKNLRLKPGMLVNALIHNAALKGEAIILPRTALLWTGARSVVYVARRLENGALDFSLREVSLGPTLGDSVSVLSGIEEGELVVASGVFAVDASAQLAGKVSMMNRGDSMNKVVGLVAAACIAGAIGCEEHKGHSQSAMQNPPAVAQDAVQNAAQVEASESKVSMRVEGSCEMCKMRIENAAKSVEGVKDAAWDVNTKTLSLSFDNRASLETVSKAIAAAGHDTEKDKASDLVYNGLPGCCKYRGD